VAVVIIIGVIGVAVLLLTATGGLLGNLSATDIAGYASNAGFTGSDLVMAVAIALAESSGNTNAVGDQTLAPTNGPSIGLWQINVGSRAHPDLADQNLTDQQVNANAAYAIYKAAGSSFAPWSTYGNGMASNNFAAASAGVTAMQNASNGVEA